MRKIVILIISVCAIQIASAQQYDIVIKGGQLIDPKNNMNALMDIAVKDGRVVRVAPHIDGAEATQVVNAKGLYVMPGLIDIHTHDFYGVDPDRAYCNGTQGLRPDTYAFRTGVTTVVDAGSSGWRSFPTFKSQVIDHSQTRILAFLNIVGEGMRGGAYEQDTLDMSARLTALVARRYRDIIVGVKVAHYDFHEWTPVDKAVEAGEMAHIPVMIDFGNSDPTLPIEDLFLKHLRPGDIFTHCFGQMRGREFILDTATQKLKPFVWEAQKKGIVFDVGYGEISFAFTQAIPALKEGFYPNSISTDMHAGSMNAAMKNLLNVMSKFLAMGMKLPDVVKDVTWNAATEIHHPELGHLSDSAVADITILGMRTGHFGFYDYRGYKITATRKLECEMTIRAGKIVYDLNGIADPVVLQKPWY